MGVLRKWGILVFLIIEIRCGEWNIGAQGKPLKSLLPNLPQGQNGCRCRGVFVVLKSRPGVRRGERVKGVSWTEGLTGSTSDLYNWKNQNPPFSEDPQGMITLLESVFYTHQPTWDDCQQLLGTLFTTEERELRQKERSKF